MFRVQVQERADKAKCLESIGLSFHEWDDYWKEDVAYQFNLSQIEKLESVTEELHRMALAACQHVIDNDLFAELGIPATYRDAIRGSFHLMSRPNQQSLYGRFDLAYDGVNEPKLLEYNADTPTSLLESAVAQWYWIKDVVPAHDQFNSLHEKLVARWKVIVPASTSVIYFASISENEEDWVCCHYLMETAVQAGFEARHVFIEALAFDNDSQYFVDGSDQKIEVLFKLYPWEWMMREQLGPMTCRTNTQFVEPIWKSLLSNKGILAIMWKLYPNHPNLLPAFFEAPIAQRNYVELTSYARKPLFSREGANTELYRDGVKIAGDEGPYGAEGYIRQALVDLPCYEQYEAPYSAVYPVVGSWVVGSDAAGICIREDSSKITTNMSNFVPHFFTEP